MVLAAAGVNCDPETVEACRLAGAEPELVHLSRLLSGDVRLRDFHMLVFPGGFSYGDHLGAGAMLASVLRRHLLGEIEELIDAGLPVLGICNGFQAIARLGLLGPVSLVGNDSGRFVCRWTRLHVRPSSCIFLGGLEEIKLPIAHGEGRVVTPPDALSDLDARAPLRYTHNPNGSMLDIAGVCNWAGTVLGLMPHPERFVSPLQHPRRDASLTPAGLAIFRNAVRYLREGP